MKGKVVHILYSGLGGTTDYVFNLIKADVHKKYEHIILFYGVEKVPKRQNELATELALYVYQVWKKDGYDQSAFHEVFQLLEKEKPQSIVLNVNSLILTCSKYKKAQLLFVEHQANHLKLKREWLWSILAQQKANKVISLTSTYQKELKSKLKFLYRKRKNILIPSGINLNSYQIDKKKVNSKLCIGMVSRINSFRDHKTLLEAFNSLNRDDVELHIAGDGPLLKSLKLLRGNKNVFLYGNIEQNEIPNFLLKLDIYVQASFGETSSIAIMQAQASALPIIATKVNGITNVLNDTNALLIEPKVMVDYVQAMLLLIDNKDKRIALAKKSHQYANENLSHIRMFEMYESVLDL